MIFFFKYIKMTNTLSAKYYQERLKKIARERYQNLSKQEKENK